MKVSIPFRVNDRFRRPDLNAATVAQIDAVSIPFRVNDRFRRD